MNDLNQHQEQEQEQQKDDDKNEDEYMDELDTSLTLLKRDKFKLLENLYRLDASVISADDKEKLFYLIQRRQQQQQQRILTQQQQQQQQQIIQQQQQEVKANQNLNSSREQEQERINRFSCNFKKFDQFRYNLQGPTPEDKKRYYTPVLNSNKYSLLLSSFYFFLFLPKLENKIRVFQPDRCNVI